MEKINRLSIVAIFIGSFLSFAIEPMIGRTLLPVFGGSPSVWVTCLAAFQILMVVGYAYAGRIGVDPRRLRIHQILLYLSVAWCVLVGFHSKSILATLGEVSGIPWLDVLVCVLALCGLSFVLLSANSTIVQMLAGNNYRLYAISNAGSLAGLLVYPLIVEPMVSLKAQWLLTGGLTAIYGAVLFLASASRQPLGIVRATEGAGCPTVRPTRSRQLLWLLLPALSCALLNATTAHLTLDVMPMPLLWAVLLALFLASYIVGFSGWGKPSLFAMLAGVSAVVAACLSAHGAKDAASFTRQLWADSALVFFGATFLHAKLYALRPDGNLLPRYYLCNVVGGAVGGVMTSIVAPIIFADVAEFPISLALLAFAVIAFSSCPLAMLRRPTSIVASALGVSSLVILALGLKPGDMGGREVICKTRGFFGTLQVMSAKAKMASGAEGAIHEFCHGNTIHGIQAKIAGKERMATCYYTSTGCGYAIEGHPKYRSNEPMRVNLVGLGVGVMFGYGRKGDYYRAYEISPEVLSVATNASLFSFVADSPADKSIVLGDARKGLETELATGVEPYDVIIVDAFTGDSIPYHLSSKEAFELYFKLLKPDGIICVNISNWHLELEPYIKRIGEDFKCPLFGLYAEENLACLDFGAKTAFFCRDPRGMSVPPIDKGQARMIRFDRVPAMKRLPTDDCGSFLSLLKL